jgi:ABC-type branched-subunit amino acid transport system substrate-binding protein
MLGRPVADRQGGSQMKRRMTWAALLAVLALLAAACGSGRSGDASPEGSDTTIEGAAATSFGDLQSPCGPGDASGATDVGVTDTSITIAYGDDAGFQQSPGLNHEMSDAVKAMIAWCNDQGGINGRKVVGNYYDAAITQVNNAMTEACQGENFALVGEGWALDSAQEQVRLGCQLPAFPAYSVSPQFANADMMFAAVPNPVDYQPITEANWYAKQHPDKAAKIGAIYGNFAATADTMDKARSTWPQVGAQFLDCQIQYNIAGEADWKPFAQSMKDCGAEAVYFVGSPYPNFENLLEAADQLDYHPDWLLEANFYDKQLASWNQNGLGDDIYVRLQDVPFEYADQNQATQDYLDIVQADGGDVSDLGAHAASAFLLWATAAQSCGSQLTRACVLDQVAGVHDWSGGGLSGAADVGQNLPSACEIVVSLDGTQWQQVWPETPAEFDCDENNVKPVSGAILERTPLGPDRKVQGQ